MCFQDRDAAGATPLHLAARFSREGVIKWLLSVGAAAGVETNCGAVPAHYSAASGDLTCLKLLMQQAPGYVMIQILVVQNLGLGLDCCFFNRLAHYLNSRTNCISFIIKRL